MSIKLKTKRNFFLIIIIFIFLFSIIINPEKYIQSCLDGILIWATVVLPSLLPFIFFTKTLSALDIANLISTRFKLFSKVFKVPAVGLYVFVMSILSGYPVGAKIVADLYECGALTKEQGYRLTTFTSNSGPMFILGSVGIGMLASRKLGFIILISHILGAILNGLLYRNHKETFKSNLKNTVKNEAISMGDLMWNTVQSVLVIGGFIALFFVIIETINTMEIFTPLYSLLSKITTLPQNIFSSVINGFFEITKGCLEISSLNISEFFRGTISCGIITFGGLATAMQAMVFLKKFEMRLGFFVKQKITHTLFSVSICAILLMIF